jgi:hypothetical protein
MAGLKVHLMLHEFPGRALKEIKSMYPGIKITTARLPHERFLKEFAKAKVCFLPNVLDASPRVLTEALCLNMPVLVNQDIVGGWKYINDITGSFFNLSNIHDGLDRCLSLAEEPNCNEWFKDNYHMHAQKRLAKFVCDNFGHKCQHLRPVPLVVPRDCPMINSSNFRRSRRCK